MRAVEGEDERIGRGDESGVVEGQKEERRGEGGGEERGREMRRRKGAEADDAHGWRTGM